MGASGAGEMPVTSNRIGIIDDGLQLEDGFAITTTENGTSVDLGVNHSAAPLRFVQLVGDVTAIDLASGDETYELELEESADASTWTTTGLKFSVAAVGDFLMGVGVKKRYVRLKKTLGGTTPSITFTAWIVPNAA